MVSVGPLNMRDVRVEPIFATSTCEKAPVLMCYTPTTPPSTWPRKCWYCGVVLNGTLNGKCPSCGGPQQR